MIDDKIINFNPCLLSFDKQGNTSAKFSIVNSPLMYRSLTTRVAHSLTLFYNLLQSLSFSKLIRGGSQTMVSVAEMR